MPGGEHAPPVLYALAVLYGLARLTTSKATAARGTHERTDERIGRKEAFRCMRGGEGPGELDPFPTSQVRALKGPERRSLF